MALPRPRRFLALAALPFALAPAAALAHLNGLPTRAPPLNPTGVGELADASYTFTWSDYDDQATTENTTIDFYFAPTNPRTFVSGTPLVDLGLTGVPIRKGVPESDSSNELTWDTSAIAPGSYFLYSIAHDPPFDIVAFARGVVTIARVGETPAPAVIVADPDGTLDVVDERFLVEYEAFDPDGTGQVRLEAQERDADAPFVIAEGLPASAQGQFEWDTSALAEGWYGVRATITDGSGRSFSAWSAAFAIVDHVSGAGGSGGTGGSGGSGGAGGSGGGSSETSGEPGTDGAGCGCAGAPGETSWLALALLARLRRRRPAHD